VTKKEALDIWLRERIEAAREQALQARRVGARVQEDMINSQLYAYESVQQRIEELDGSPPAPEMEHF
jgi:hypothetical protein